MIEQYVLEAVTAFERQAHFASAVMLGAASEKALYALAESLLGAIKNSTEREKLQNLFDRRRLFALFDFMQKTISVASKRALPHAISEGATTHMMSIYEAIRVQRNDAVHPMNASVSADSVCFYSYPFPTHFNEQKHSGHGSGAIRKASRFSERQRLYSLQHKNKRRDRVHDTRPITPNRGDG